VQNPKTSKDESSLQAFEKHILTQKKIPVARKMMSEEGNKGNHQYKGITTFKLDPKDKIDLRKEENRILNEVRTY
tara:strand:+ start:264 stop:488 length:225 start_codon:yes stop_codon:yes gene_type:complete